MTDELYDAGMAVRRKVLGAAHVDRAAANTKPYNKDFQDFITRFGWGEIWTRPHFDHRLRRILVIGTMMALGRWEEFRMHLRAALADGFSMQDVTELFLQQSIYCGFPVTNTAYHHLADIIAELKAQGVAINGLEE